MARTHLSGARVFSGSEIRAAILEAVESIDEESEITEFHAGENMQITLVQPAYATPDRERGCYDVTLVGFDTLAWTGTGWDLIESR